MNGAGYVYDCGRDTMIFSTAISTKKISKKKEKENPDERGWKKSEKENK